MSRVPRIYNERESRMSRAAAPRRVRAPPGNTPGAVSTYPATRFSVCRGIRDCALSRKWRRHRFPRFSYDVVWLTRRERWRGAEGPRGRRRAIQTTARAYGSKADCSPQKSIIFIRPGQKKTLLNSSVCIREADSRSAFPSSCIPCTGGGGAQDFLLAHDSASQCVLSDVGQIAIRRLDNAHVLIEPKLPYYSSVRPLRANTYILHAMVLASCVVIKVAGSRAIPFIPSMLRQVSRPLAQIICGIPRYF
jgi:hypothetical protein